MAIRQKMAGKSERYTDWVELDSGITATVYRVYDRHLDRQVAIKLLHEKYKSRIDLLKSEVNYARELRHPNVCAIYDIYEGEQGVGILMDYVEGINLKSWLIDNQGRRAATFAERFKIFARLAEVLEFVHEHPLRLIHRDLKPANVFLRGGDCNDPVIIDFGISLSGDDVRGSRSGTPAYMAPEQLSDPENIDQRCDLFAFGVMGYELFAGFKLETYTKSDDGDQYALVPNDPQVLPEPSRFNPLLPCSMDHLIMSLLAFDPEQRPATARVVKDFINRVDLPEQSDIQRTGIISYHQSPGYSPRTPETVLIPGGEFEVGVRPMEGRIANQKPARKVILTPFRMTRSPVTNSDFKDFIKFTGHEVPPLLDDPLWGADDQPVVMVTWYDAMSYAEWAGATLPTEAQWEFCARDGRQQNYPWREESDPTVLHANIFNVKGNPIGVGRCLSGAGETFGLFDLIGNVWEWCRDDWDEDYYHKLKDGINDPVSQCGIEGLEQQKSCRGGAYDSSFSSEAKSTYRSRASATARMPNIGFRLLFPA